MAVNRDLIGQAETFDRADRTVLDMDSSESPVHGQQEGSAYNGHFESVCDHPLFCSMITVTAWRRSCDRVTSPARRLGRAASAGRSNGSRRRGKRVAFRADAAFARPAILRGAGGARRGLRHPHPGQQESGAGDRGRAIPVTGTAQPHAARPLQERPVSGGQLDDGPTGRGESRTHVGELFPRVGFIVTNLPLQESCRRAVYNKRGTAEQWSKEGKQAAHWTRLSCHRFRANEVRLQLSVLAYNLGNLWRAAGAAEADRHLVVDQSPAAPRQDGRAAW